jgi:hypothetical protein
VTPLQPRAGATALITSEDKIVKPLAIDEILDINDYERDRPELRERVLALKARRRTLVGPHMTLLWENRETARYQVQEMMRIERIQDVDAVRHEVETYNELVPTACQLKATLLIEYEDGAERDRALRALLGLETHVSLAISGCAPTRAEFDTRQMSRERLSSVQFLTFDLPPGARDALLQGRAAEIVVDHPAYRATAAIGLVTLAELQADLLAE